MTSQKAVCRGNSLASFQKEGSGWLTIPAGNAFLSIENKRDIRVFKLVSVMGQDEGSVRKQGKF